MITSHGPRRRIGRSDLLVHPLAIGGDVFGWTADERTSFEVLDAYVEAGGNFVDTADVYSAWAPGHRGGESETVVGRWLASRGGRDDLVVASKVSQHPELRGLAPETIRRAVDGSLGRLGIDRIDLYYAHYDDPSVPLAETVGAFSELVDAGKVRCTAPSNYSGDRLREWIAVARAGGYHLPVAVQPLYNLVERGFEDDQGPVAAAEGLGVVPFSALAGGFLTGKYRDGGPADSGRTDGTSRYLDDRGRRVLAALDAVAARHGVAVATVAIAWVRSRPGIVAPISSARSVEQLADVLRGATLELEPDDVAALDAASAP